MKKIKTYRNKEFENGVTSALVCLDASNKHRLMFDYIYTRSNIPGDFPVNLYNETNLTIDYLDGLSQKAFLIMNLMTPKRLEQGHDLKSNLVLEFPYKKEKGIYRMKSFQIKEGAMKQTTHDLSSLEENLIKQIEFPFPIEDVLACQAGAYSVPFLRMDGIIDFFNFPDNLKERDVLELNKGRI